MNKAIDYLKSTKEEMKRVKWPSRRETIVYTVAVIAIAVGVAYFLGFFDYLFSLGLAKLLTL